MKTWVYRCSRKADTYLYLAREDDFEALPEALSRLLGTLERVMEVDLAEREKLARIAASELQQRLKDDGYWLQLPPDERHPFDRESLT